MFKIIEVSGNVYSSSFRRKSILSKSKRLLEPGYTNGRMVLAEEVKTNENQLFVYVLQKLWYYPVPILEICKNMYVE